MKSLATTSEAKALDKLIKDINSKNLTPNQAWTCLTLAKEKIKLNENLTYILTKQEAADLTTLSNKLKTHLKGKINKRCSYCKRIMGQHGKSWNIEHIFCKSKHPDQTFKLSNLTYACLDCNLVKNNTVDRKNPYIFDIINPNTTKFDYSKHIELVHISTEKIQILKYWPISEEGINTYKKLHFDALENLEILGSINAPTRQLRDKIDERIDELTEREETDALVKFLHELKLRIFTPR